MSNTSTATMVSRLKELAGKAGQSVYERLGMVQEILADKEYVAAHYGTESKALETLEADCFGDLCGARSLTELLAVRREYPDEAQWKKHKWNLSRLLAEWDMRRDEEKRAEREEDDRPKQRTVVKVREHEEVKQQLAETACKLDMASREKEAARSEADELRMRVRELERENIELRAKLEELERLLDGRLAGMRR